jgi:hypothetical protein
MLSSVFIHPGYIPGLNEEAPMNTILVPLDGSELAQAALPYAQLLATTFSARLHLLRVLSSADQEDLFISPATVLYKRTVASGVNRERTHRIWTMLREQAEAELQAQAALLREAGFDVLVDIQVGPPAETIVKITDRSSLSIPSTSRGGPVPAFVPFSEG